MARFRPAVGGWNNIEVEHVKTTGELKNVHIRTVEPTSGDGADGDVWIKVTP